MGSKDLAVKGISQARKISHIPSNCGKVTPTKSVIALGRRASGRTSSRSSSNISGVSSLMGLTPDRQLITFSTSNPTAAEGLSCDQEYASRRSPPGCPADDTGVENGRSCMAVERDIQDNEVHDDDFVGVESDRGSNVSKIYQTYSIRTRLVNRRQNC